MMRPVLPGRGPDPGAFQDAGGCFNVALLCDGKRPAARNPSRRYGRGPHARHGSAVFHWRLGAGPEPRRQRLPPMLRNRVLCCFACGQIACRAVRGTCSGEAPSNFYPGYELVLSSAAPFGCGATLESLLWLEGARQGYNPYLRACGQGYACLRAPGFLLGQDYRCHRYGRDVLLATTCCSHAPTLKPGSLP